MHFLWLLNEQEPDSIEAKTILENNGLVYSVWNGEKTTFSEEWWRFPLLVTPHGEFEGIKEISAYA